MVNQSYLLPTFIFSADLGHFILKKKNVKQDIILLKALKNAKLFLKLEGFIPSSMSTGGDEIPSILPPPVAPPMHRAIELLPSQLGITKLPPTQPGAAELPPSQPESAELSHPLNPGAASDHRTSVISYVLRSLNEPTFLFLAVSRQATSVSVLSC